MQMKKFLIAAVLAALIHIPIAAWLQPPFFASWALGIAAFCLARASIGGHP